MKTLTYLVICSSLLMSFVGCAYEQAYTQYSLSQAAIAQASGPIVTFHPNGQLASVGNPMIPLIGMQMRGPKSDWDGFWDVLKTAVPFGAIWGIVGAMSTANHGTTTNVSGTGNFTGNTAGGTSQWASPVTTTTTNNLPDGLIAD